MISEASFNATAACFIHTTDKEAPHHSTGAGYIKPRKLNQ
jgi:hypothetical protein